MLKNTDDTTKLFLIGIVFLVMIVYILITSITDSKKVDYSFVSDSLNNIKENYSLDVKMKNKNIKYSNNSGIELFESKEFENNKYIKYNNKVYVYDKESIKEIENNNDLIDKYYYDMNLINKVIEYCKFKKSAIDSVSCNIKSDIYNKELSSLYGVGYSDETPVTLVFYYNNKIVNKMIGYYGNESVTISINNSVDDLKPLIEKIK